MKNVLLGLVALMGLTIFAGEASPQLIRRYYPARSAAPATCSNGNCAVAAPVAIAAPATSVVSEGPKSQEVFTTEVIRRGNHVVIAGEGPREGPEENFRAATAPPADDNHKWHVTLWIKPGEAASEALRRDFLTKPELNAFIAAEPPTNAWGHFVVLNVDDATQKWRLDRTKQFHFKVDRTPTLVIQPPRNGRFGDVRLVIMQEAGYNGDAKALKERIIYAVRKYSTKLYASGYVWSATKSGGEEPTEGPKQAAGEGGFGGPTPAPFAVPPVVDPFNPLAPPLAQVPHYPAPAPAGPFGPQPIPNFPPPDAPLAPVPPQTPAPDTKPVPAPAPVGGFLMSLLAGFAGMGTLLGLAGTAWGLWRMFAKATGKPLLISDADYQAAMVLLAAWKGGNLPGLPPAPAPVPAPNPTGPVQTLVKFLADLKPSR